jgi:hypothetical protein
VTRALLLAALLLPATSCYLNDPYFSPVTLYSSSVKSWIESSMALRYESAGMREAIGVSDEAGLRARLREIAMKQRELNDHLKTLAPVAEWREYHPRMLEAVVRYEEASANLLGPSPAEPLPVLAGQLDAELRALRERVVNCYVQSPACG